MPASVIIVDILLLIAITMNLLDGILSTVEGKIKRAWIKISLAVVQIAIFAILNQITAAALVK